MTVRVVHLTGGVPVASVPHAGGVLQRDVTRSLLEQGTDVLVLAPAHRGNREDLPASIAPRTELPEDWPRRWSPAGIAVRAAHRLNRWAHGAALQHAHPPFVASLLLQRRTRRALRDADVIDLQWFAQIRLLPMVRLLAGPRPVIVGTFHDVVSQRIERTASLTPPGKERDRLLTASRRARREERWCGRRLDRSVVLSEKDRDLLLEAGVPAERITVLAPRIASRGADAPGGEHVLPPAGGERAARPVVLFVGYLGRPENRDAVHWLLSEIWPRVRSSMPEACLRIVGGGAPDGLHAQIDGTPGATATGFVEDLDAEYRGADCCVVPLRDGAGVKFKTIEALLSGVPTVATTIGAEGVGRREDFVALSDETEGLVAGILAALRDPERRRHAAETAERLARLHDPCVFDRTVLSVYATGRSGAR
ncbi:glycosyltransferase [Brachybacterium saurashtrense]|uniref:glycosyltransferase n=1 Tax=Brachybacterium saurashtrense TaxID=556288 RepID=UPI0013B3DA68|nr:glycosyltransferase [Brachybacterium saurashtrense]